MAGKLHPRAKVRLKLERGTALLHTETAAGLTVSLIDISEGGCQCRVTLADMPDATAAQWRESLMPGSVVRLEITEPPEMTGLTLERSEIRWLRPGRGSSIDFGVHIRALEAAQLDILRNAMLALASNKLRGGRLTQSETKLMSTATVAPPASVVASGSFRRLPQTGSGEESAATAPGPEPLTQTGRFQNVTQTGRFTSVAQKNRFISFEEGYGPPPPPPVPPPPVPPMPPADPEDLALPPRPPSGLANAVRASGMYRRLNAAESAETSAVPPPDDSLPPRRGGSGLLNVLQRGDAPTAAPLPVPHAGAGQLRTPPGGSAAASGSQTSVREFEMQAFERQKRHALQLPIFYQFCDKEKVLFEKTLHQGRTLDFNEGGFLIEGTGPAFCDPLQLPSRNAYVLATISGHNGDLASFLKVRSVRQGQQAPGIFQIGVQIEEMTDEDRRLLREMYIRAGLTTLFKR